MNINMLGVLIVMVLLILKINKKIDIDNRLIIALIVIIMINILYASNVEYLDPATDAVAQAYVEGNMSLQKLNIANDLSVGKNISTRHFNTAIASDSKQLDENGSVLIDKINVLSPVAFRSNYLDFGTEKSKPNQSITMGLGGSYIRPVPATAHQWDLTHELTSGNLSIGECYNDPAKPAGAQWTCLNKVNLNGKNGDIALNGNVNAISDLNIGNNVSIRGNNVDFNTEKSKQNQTLAMGLGGSYLRPVPATAHQWDLTHDLATGNLSIGECYNDPAKPAGAQWTCVNKVNLNGKNGGITLNGDVTVNGKLQVNGDLSNTQNATFAADSSTRGKTRVYVGTDMFVANTLAVRDALLLANSGTNTWAITHDDKNDDSGELGILPVTISDSNGFVKYVPDLTKPGAVKLIKNFGLTMTGEVHAGKHT